MWKSWTLQVLAIALALVAAYLSAQLLAKHISGSTGPAWFAAACVPDDEPGGADCAAVLASPYSYYPPKFPDAAEDEAKGHIPVAFLGMLYYSMLSAWLIGVGAPTRDRRWFHLLPLGFVACGLASSVYFLYIMFVKLDEWCLWCLVTHICNIGLAVCLVMMWPREPKTAPTETKKKTAAHASTATLRSGHPSGRLVVATMLAVFAIAFAQKEMLSGANGVQLARQLQTGYDRCMAAVKSIKSDGDKLMKNWQLAERQELKVREDDAIRTYVKGARQKLECVVYSDFQCPQCKKLAKFLEEKAQPMFDGGLKIVYRHFPLSKDCNGTIGRTLHKQACSTAAVAESARILRGNDGFWAAHDYLFENLGKISRGQLDTHAIAAALGYDRDELVETMKSEAVAKRIYDDVNAARTFGVDRTPVLFVNGRRVDTLARLEVGFWDKMANLYWTSIKELRPPSTKLTAP